MTPGVEMRLVLQVQRHGSLSLVANSTLYSCTFLIRQREGEGGLEGERGVCVEKHLALQLKLNKRCYKLHLWVQPRFFLKKITI